VRGPATEVAHGSRTRPELALTFHGGGDPGLADELLAIFALHRSPVTVMAVGTWLESNPTIAPRIVAAGHELGNHTYHHRDLTSLSGAALLAEITGCRDLLRAQTGSGGNYFRPSQAQHATTTVLAAAGAAGYPVCLSYDVDSLDYTDPGPAAIRRAVARAGPGSVISMHFGHRDTVTAMPSILADLAARGLAPVTVSHLLRP
jgi:peptidoglycan/xylan/chitin deacetylase (PgdA/CDA1 family)